MTCVAFPDSRQWATHAVTQTRRRDSHIYTWRVTSSPAVAVARLPHGPHLVNEGVVKPEDGVVRRRAGAAHARLRTVRQADDRARLARDRRRPRTGFAAMQRVRRAAAGSRSQRRAPLVPLVKMQKGVILNGLERFNGMVSKACSY